MKDGSGVFVDCRAFWKGRIGQTAVSWSKYEGGAMRIGTDGADRGDGLEAVKLRLGLRLRLECTDCGQDVMIRQESDPAPKFHFLEEGPVRLGMRVAFDLLDEAGHYHGDGRQDIWLYPEGDVHITWSVITVDRAAHGAIRDCYVDAEGADSYRQIRLGDEVIDRPGGEVALGFGTSLPQKAVVLSGDSGTAGLYWARDEGHVWEIASDHGRVPPFYASRWPTGMQQWVGQMGWNCAGEKAGVNARLDPDGPWVRLSWQQEAEEQELRIGATLVVSLTEDLEQLGHRMAAVQQPLVPEVNGGNFRCYTEEDGTYEIGQGDPTRVEILFPPDPLQRPARLRFYRRKTDPRHRGGVRASANGESLPVQLMSEGELTDDICVVMEMSDRNDSVDDVLVTAPLSADEPTTVVIEKVPGIQAVYQSEITGVDLQRRAGNRRDIAVWSNHNKEKPAYELDLFSCAVHRPTQHGQAEPALWEMPMAWFSSCGNSKHQYCNFIKEFSQVENGPEAVEFYLRGTNPNQRAQSELWLRTPYGHPRLRLEVRMRLEILEQWDDSNVEFSDIFPYPSRLVETWFHDAVLFLQRDKSAMVYTYRPDTSVHSGGQSDDDRLFYGLFATERGNVLTLIKNPQHPEHALHYSVCGNYIDVHVNFHPGQMPLPAGTVFEVDYITEIYGDADTSADEIRRIGMASLEAGDIVIE